MKRWEKPMADKKVDLTKFDFHAMRFAHSEDCQRMTDAEVGQYLLLMIQAWLGGKAASLPNDPALLARYARCEKVSDLVMSKWDLRDGRLYNDMQSEEWARTSLRVAESNAKYKASIDSGKKGGESKSEAKAEAAKANGMKGGRPKTEAPIGLEANGETQPTMPL